MNSKPAQKFPNLWLNHTLGRDPGVLAWKAASGSLNNEVEISAAATAEDTVWNLCQVDFVLEQTSSK